MKIQSLDEEEMEAIAHALAPRMIREIEKWLEEGASQDRWMNSREAAEYLAIPPSTLRKLTASCAIPFAQESEGANCYFKRSDLDQWRWAMPQSNPL